MPHIMPSVLSTKLTFMDYYTFNSGAGAAFLTHAFRLNSPYDPDAAAGGGTPTGFNQLAAVYGKYRVMGAKISIWGYSTCNSASMLSIFARGTAGAAPTSSTEVQQKTFEYGRNVRRKDVAPYVAGDGIRPYQISYYRSVRSLEGIRAATDDDYSSVCTSTPVSQCYFDVNICAMDGATANISGNLRIQIKYYIKFSQMTVAITD